MTESARLRSCLLWRFLSKIWKRAGRQKAPMCDNASLFAETCVHPWLNMRWKGTLRSRNLALIERFYVQRHRHGKIGLKSRARYCSPPRYCFAYGGSTVRRSSRYCSRSPVQSTAKLTAKIVWMYGKTYWSSYIAADNSNNLYTLRRGFLRSMWCNQLLTAVYSWCLLQKISAG